MGKKIRLKISIIGPPSSGKSSFINNLLQKPVDQVYRPTEQYELSIHSFSKNRVQYQIQLWECGSKHKLYNKHIRQAFFKNSSAAFLIFDLTDPKWKQKVQEWLLEAYQFDCFLVYAIGTKKDLLFKQKYEKMYGRLSAQSNTLSQQLLESKGVETLDELDINKFFQEFQIKHFFQSAVQPFHKSIKNIFVGIENDQQRITRSSLAVGRRFDNTVIDIKSQYQGREYKVNEMSQSVRMEEIEQEKEKVDEEQNQVDEIKKQKI